MFMFVGQRLGVSTDGGENRWPQYKQCANATRMKENVNKVVVRGCITKV